MSEEASIATLQRLFENVSRDWLKHVLANNNGNVQSTIQFLVENTSLNLEELGKLLFALKGESKVKIFPTKKCYMVETKKTNKKYIRPHPKSERAGKGGQINCKILPEGTWELTIKKNNLLWLQKKFELIAEITDALQNIYS